ncbi:tyrosine-protein phosphatase [Enterococcus pernyi]|uniref:tyrosine-protein phosphatase n=1 Tax=Enterococcus pernyi TaxID=590158 RepID=UPI000789AC2C|nr:CpsB/CapC family capsule biosynthesis tyrosine phosphatase [Enterococcus pernyi]
MIDLHCHILPGIDDGPKTVKESIAMAEEAVRQGITHILCTPHHNQRFTNEKADVLLAVEDLQKELDRQSILLTLFEGQEVRIKSNLIDEIKSDKILFADVADRYLLAELPTNSIPEYTESLFYELRQMGIVPIIVHPERNRGFQESPNLLLPYLNMGCLAQLTAPSIAGVYGKQIKKLSEELVQHRLVQMIASDAHSRNDRDFYMEKAYSIVEKKFGSTVIEEMDQVTRDIINGEQVHAKDFRPIV